MRFVQLHMAHEFYVTYAKKVRFATKIRMTTCDKITKEPVNQAIYYNRDMFCGSLTKHQHGFQPPDARELVMLAKCVIKDNDEVGIRSNKTFLALANEARGPFNLGFSEKDLRNYITVRLRTSNLNVDVREMMNYFMRMKDINLNFFYAVKLHEECKFRSAVWVDARCRALYEYYGDVVLFNSTYSTNMHGLPFPSFVSVNHHDKSTFLSCALLGNEKISSALELLHRGSSPINADQCFVRSKRRYPIHATVGASGTL
ncbi:protein FAR1-RELATED SEQUENCE 5-like [Arachis duranensis]|uniref:Protein FAR1-RELATED SEQUENCE 5-like n=1 Tax=Arachis duranensis TaxID=130453 RepID=A0A9C6TZ33_ARADU|nr:protein FAR1-RELATED SEQUENCE 5-like [Arachis duranensis]